MIITPFLAPLLLAAGLSASPCILNEPVSLLHDGDYGPFGDGPSFQIELGADGGVMFRSHQWQCSSGTYQGRFTANDTALLSCLLRDLSSISGLPFTCGGFHTPGFMVVLPRSGFVAGTCVSLVPGTPLQPVLAALPGFVTRANWSSFSPEIPKPREQPVP